MREKSACHSRPDYSNYKSVSVTNFQRRMKIEVAFCLLSLAFLPACSTTSQTTGANQTLEQRLMAKYASNATEPGTPGEEPAPPAEGPDDVPADAPATVDQNPALMPSPLLRYWAASRTP
jgi:hypothetical protein